VVIVKQQDGDKKIHKVEFFYANGKEKKTQPKTHLRGRQNILLAVTHFLVVYFS
jgi:hypothetical protein